jgi:uncharacterized membrane protein (UPF0127 family)
MSISLKFARVAWGGAACLAAFAAFAQMPQISLGAGIHVVQAEVAYTNDLRMQGLMFRKSLGPNQGMLFVWPQDEAYCMWMRNTYIPLSVAFIDAKGSIVSVHEMKPQTENSHCAASPARYALEMNAGWFKAKGLQRGARITGLEKAPAPQ